MKIKSLNTGVLKILMFWEKATLQILTFRKVTEGRSFPSGGLSQ